MSLYFCHLYFFGPYEQLELTSNSHFFKEAVWNLIAVPSPPSATIFLNPFRRKALVIAVPSPDFWLNATWGVSSKICRIWLFMFFQFLPVNPPEEFGFTANRVPVLVRSLWFMEGLMDTTRIGHSLIWLIVCHIDMNLQTYYPWWGKTVNAFRSYLKPKICTVSPNASRNWVPQHDSKKGRLPFACSSSVFIFASVSWVAFFNFFAISTHTNVLAYVSLICFKEIP